MACCLPLAPAGRKGPGRELIPGWYVLGKTPPAGKDAARPDDNNSRIKVMKSILVAAAAVLVLGAAPVAAQSDAGAAVGAGAGGVSGAITGGLIFGPIGAIIGGFTGAVIGASVVSEAAVDYARANPTDPIVIEGEIDVGYVVPEEVEVRVVEGDEDYGYFYTEDRLWFVDLDSREVVYSPGTVVAVEAE